MNEIGNINFLSNNFELSFIFPIFVAVKQRC